MRSPDPTPYRRVRAGTLSQALAAVLCALALLGLAGCHGRPLLSQMAPAHAPSSGRAETLPALGTAPASRGLSLEGLDEASRLSNPANRMERHDFRRIAQDMARRNPAISNPCTPKPHARAVLDRVLAHPAAPAFEGPGKAFVPAGVCVDPVALTVLVVYTLLGRQR